MNLDRFSRPMNHERNWKIDEEEGEKSICLCSECEADLFEGDDVFIYDDERFCSKECAIDWVFDNEIRKDVMEEQ